MTNEFFKVPKKLKNVTLWVHPEGRVVGGLFVKQQSSEHAGAEDPIELLNNQGETFLVFQHQQPLQTRFYNKASIIRVEYDSDQINLFDETESIQCQLQMMDGVLISGNICELLPPNRSRLFDYLNRKEERFIRLFDEGKGVCLVNKSYIIHATNLSSDASV